MKGLEYALFTKKAFSLFKLGFIFRPEDYLFLILFELNYVDLILLFIVL